MDSKTQGMKYKFMELVMRIHGFYFGFIFCKKGYDITNTTKGGAFMACIVNITNGIMDQQEINAYISRATEKYGTEPIRIDITLDGDEVELDYTFEPHPFHRIRRITGYLVGTLDRFNNAKRCEERERVKHTLSREA